MVQFDALSPQEAKAYLERFLSAMPQRLADLAERSGRSGGPTSADLDGSIESLGPLWGWASSQGKWRPGYTPSRPGDTPVDVDLSAIDESAQPDWFGENPYMWGMLSTETLWVIDGVGRYYGEVIRTSVPKGRWKVGKARTKNYIYHQHPVVTGSNAMDDVQPFHAVGGLIRRVLWDMEHADLVTFADQWRGATTQHH